MKNLSPKEAITILESMKVDIPVPKAAVTQIKRNVALNMAIDALLRRSEISNDSDTISRQDAIDALGEEPEVWLENDEYAQGLNNQWHYDVNAIKAMPSAQPEQRWIPVTERLPEEDHWFGGSGRQFSDEVLVSVANYDGEDIWTYISQTIDGKWALELSSPYKIIAWMPLPEPYKGGDTE